MNLLLAVRIQSITKSYNDGLLKLWGLNFPLLKGNWEYFVAWDELKLLGRSGRNFRRPFSRCISNFRCARNLRLRLGESATRFSQKDDAIWNCKTERDYGIIALARKNNSQHATYQKVQHKTKRGRRLEESEFKSLLFCRGTDRCTNCTIGCCCCCRNCCSCCCCHCCCWMASAGVGWRGMVSPEYCVSHEHRPTVWKMQIKLTWWTARGLIQWQVLYFHWCCENVCQTSEYSSIDGEGNDLPLSYCCRSAIGHCSNSSFNCWRFCSSRSSWATCSAWRFLSR